jgi:predicted negative regulator of RcsB-dependent stress response
MRLPVSRSKEMKRIYRPFPSDGTDIWIVVILIIGLLLYVAWRWV